MNVGKTLFAQLMDFLPWTSLARYGGDKGVRSLTCAATFQASSTSPRASYTMSMPSTCW